MNGIISKVPLRFLFSIV